MSCGDVSPQRCDIKSLNLAQPLHKDQKMNTTDDLDFWKVAADDDMNNLFTQLLLNSKKNSETPQNKGSPARRAANIERGREHHANQIIQENFSDASNYLGNKFKRRFTVSKQILF